MNEINGVLIWHKITMCWIVPVARGLFHIDPGPNLVKRLLFTHIFNKNDNHDKCNYRPVNVLTSMSKLFERILVQQLGDNVYEISGFIKKKTRQNVLLNLVEDIKYETDHGNVVLPDLSCAFDLSYYLLYCVLMVSSNMYANSWWVLWTDSNICSNK